MGDGEGVTLLYDPFITPTTVEKVRAVVLTNGWAWQVRSYRDYVGWEADSVVCLGYGDDEAVTRARVRVAIIRCWDSEEGRRVYELLREGYQAVVREGGLEEQRL